MAAPEENGRREKARQRHAVSRSVHLYALLIAALVALNVLLYWERGTPLSLVVAGVAAVVLVGYLVYARRVMKSM